MSNKANNHPDLLLVDDDKSLLRLLTIRLEGEGYNVTAVEDGQSALKKLQNSSFDVVLSDLRMPGLDGLSLFEEIMAIRQDIPVILMTAHGTIADAIEATQRGVFGFLPKPVEHEELRALLQNLLLNVCECPPPEASGNCFFELDKLSQPTRKNTAIKKQLNLIFIFPVAQLLHCDTVTLSRCQAGRISFWAMATRKQTSA